MRKFKVIAAVLIIASITFIIISCQSSANPQTPNPTAPDDIIPAPGFGPTYRGNIHEVPSGSTVSATDFPPLIKETTVTIGNGTDAPQITYRDYIETKAGETRNNIVSIRILGQAIENANVKVTNVPPGLAVEQTNKWTGGGITFVKIYLGIKIDSNVKPGEYTFNIGIVVQGRDYGSVPCTVRVTE